MYLHLCCITYTNQHFTTTHSINRDEAINDPSFKKYHVVANKLNPLSRCHVTANVNSPCHATVGSKTKLPSIDK